MYDNIGNKIKTLAKVIFAIEAVASVIGAIILFFNDAHILLCIAVAVVGVIFSWISTWLLYGFGEIIVKLCNIEENTKNNNIVQKPEKQSTPKIICENCGKSISKYPCVICGHNPNNIDELAQNYDKID